MHPALFVYAIISMVIVGILILLILFEPGLKYLVHAPEAALDSDQFLCLVGALSDAEIHDNSSIETLTNGDVFYEAELSAIRAAKHSINMERYIFAKGEVAQRYLDAMTERAKAGVKVKLVVDAIGSFTTWNSYFKKLRDAGGKVEWYQPPWRLHSFKRFNNRTHRELLVVDGEVAFVGGAGVADWWFKSEKKKPQWRDTMFRVKGELVIGLQTGFAENWLESSGEILSGDDYFPLCTGEPWRESGQGVSGLVIISSPSAGRATRARVLFQLLLASARKSIVVTTPYFLPDRRAREEMICAIRERGVSLRIVTPGEHADHLMTRRAGRRRFGSMLQAGAEIFEYRPSMIHAKIMIIDDLWCVVGTTNFDNRSFGLNDEVNLATADKDLAKRLQEDFDRDVANSDRVTYEQWSKRPMTERMVEWASWILERQS